MSVGRSKVGLWVRGRRCIRSGCRHGFLGVIPQVGTTLAASSVLRVSRDTAMEVWAQTRRIPSRYSQLARLSDVVSPAQPGARRSEGGFSNDDQGMDEEHRKLLELEKSLLEQHAPEQLSAMFRLERGAAEGGRASRSAARIFSSAAENSTAAGATAERDNTSQLIHSELLRQHRDTPMSEQRRKAWQKFPDLDSADTIVPRPRRIIVMRHGESMGNVDELVYTTTPDWKIPLTQFGYAQAAQVAPFVRELIGDSSVYIYHSPYVRTAQTCAQILQHLPAEQVKAVREEPRISEQQFGNLHHLHSIRTAKVERKMYGRFFYRFKNGEAGLDVYSRISSFIGTLRRDHLEEQSTVLIVTHGLALRLFLMRFFQWTVEQFEATHNPPNCGIVVMDRLEDGRYRLTPASLEMIGAHQAPRMSSIGRNIFRRAFVDTFLSY